MTLREHISIARRSWRLLYSMSRRFFAAILAYSVVTALLPYIPVWFSARLIDALAAGAGVQVLIRYAALTVGLTALGTLLSAVLNAQKEIGFQEANCSYEWMHAEKAMALAYASIEDREVSLLRERIQTETRMGWNVFYLDSCIEKFVRFGVQIFASIALTASFFTLHAIAPAAKLAFVGGILVSIVVAVLTSARSSAINMEFLKDGVTENITLDKYSTYIRNYSSGKDIRLYAMTAPLAKYAGNFYKTICDREARLFPPRAAAAGGGADGSCAALRRLSAADLRRAARRGQRRLHRAVRYERHAAACGGQRLCACVAGRHGQRPVPQALFLLF